MCPQARAEMELPRTKTCSTHFLPLYLFPFTEQKQKRPMEVLSMLIFFLPVLFSLFQPSHSSTILVDGVSEWKNSTVHVGDSIVFKHKYHYNLYIFRNQGAFNLCDFARATLLSKPNSTSYTWHPSRPGFFYFAFSNETLKACQAAERLAIKVSSTPPPEASIMPPELPPAAAPVPSSGGIVSSSPSFPWPFRPHQAASPGPAPTADSPVTLPSIVPDKGGGMPFINSNPAVPLPTGEVDSATIRPLPTSGHGEQVMEELFAVQMALFCAVFLML